MTTTSLKVHAQSLKIDVRDLNFYYGRFHALKNISLQIPRKQVTAFIDPSDYGKSTLPYTFNRIYMLYPEQRAEGQINVGGENPPTSCMDIALLRAKVGMVFQKPTPSPMLIYDNTAFGMKLSECLSRSETDDRVEWALTRAVLWNEVKDKLSQSNYSLSDSQQQRLYVARGIAIRPEALLLDEPCSTLNPISTGKIEELIAELKDDCTVVIVTHNIRQTACCFGYTAYMHLSELIEFGDAGKIFIRPQRKGVKDYITGCFG